MDIVKGIIAKINVKEPEQRVSKAGKPFKYAGYGIQIGDQWYNGMAFEKNNECWPVDKNGNKMQVGQEVELLLETNDKGYTSIVGKSSQILSGGTPTPPQPQQQQQKAPSEAPIKAVDTFPITVYTHVLNSVASIAKGVTVKTSEDKVVEVMSDHIIRIADRVYDHVMKK